MSNRNNRPRRRQINRQNRAAQKSQDFLENNWHRFVAAMMWKHGIKETTITPADFRRAISMFGVNLQLEQKSDGLLMRIVTKESPLAPLDDVTPPETEPGQGS